MKKYIDAEGVMRACYDSFLKTGNKAYREIFALVEAVPAADVVEVVRCNDCKYRDAEKGFCEGRGWPMQLVPDDGFCDKGERKTSDE